MSKKQKILFIFPPVASPVSPYLSLPLLAGQLETAGFDVTCLDLSVDFFDYVLDKKFLLKAYNKAKEHLIELREIVDNRSPLDSEVKNYSSDLKISILKKEHIEKVITNDDDNLSLINDISSYVKKYKESISFYDLNEMNDACLKVAEAFKLAMLPYYPAMLYFHFYKNRMYTSTYSGLKQQVFDEKNNIFYEFYKQKINEYKLEEYELVYITCPNETQILPSMTFAKVLKDVSNPKIVIGGNIISRVADELQKLPKLYDEFFDFVISGLGEKSVVKLADFILNQKGSLSSIKGLIYKSGEKIKKNNPDLKYNINKSANLSLNGIDLKKYYTPDIIMPIQSSKGCYWGKCTFCGLHCPPKKYTVKDVKKAVDEIEYLNKNYGIEYFEFIDEAIHPKYLAKLADEIISRNINIKYVCCARMEEKYYTQDVCERLYKSGLRIIQFGYESAVKRVYESLNKGIKFENRIECIRKCSDAGIFTYLYAIIGYPNETKEDALETISIIDKNSEIIDFLFIHNFWLDKKSPAYKNYKKIGIKEIIKNKTSIFAQKSDFVTDFGEYKKCFNSVYETYCKKTHIFKNIFFSPDEHIFLYILHYGREKAKEILCGLDDNTDC